MEIGIVLDSFGMANADYDIFKQKTIGSRFGKSRLLAKAARVTEAIKICKMWMVLFLEIFSDHGSLRREINDHLDVTLLAFQGLRPPIKRDMPGD
jgi:hypothetical protein